MKTKNLLLLLLLSLFLISCQPSVPEFIQEVDWPEFNKEYFEEIGVNVTEYSNEELEIYFLYHSDWDLTEKLGENQILLEKNVKGEDILIQVNVEKTEFESIDDYIKITPPPVHNQIAAERTEGETAEEKSLFEYGSTNQNGKTKSTISVYVVHNDKLYSLIYYEPKDFLGGPGYVFDTVVASLRFI